MIMASSPKGPVWFADHECLLWSDIPANRIMRLTADGQVSVFRQDSNHTNGNTRDRQGRLVSCEHSGRRVTRTGNRRHDHGARRQLRGQAAQFSQ